MMIWFDVIMQHFHMILYSLIYAVQGRSCKVQYSRPCSLCWPPVYIAVLRYINIYTVYMHIFIKPSIVPTKRGTQKWAPTRSSTPWNSIMARWNYVDAPNLLWVDLKFLLQTATDSKLNLVKDGLKQVNSENPWRKFTWHVWSLLIVHSR